jgi:hypothetical protein
MYLFYAAKDIHFEVPANRIDSTYQLILMSAMHGNYWPSPETKQAPSASEILREIAEDYHNMAKDGDGKADYLRTRNYLWLRKLAGRIPGAKKR